MKKRLRDLVDGDRFLNYKGEVMEKTPDLVFPVGNWWLDACADVEVEVLLSGGAVHRV